MTWRSNAVTPRHVIPIAPRLRGDGTPARVLIVITNALANLVAVTLRHGPYETHEAVDEEAIRTTMREWQPDLAVIDIDHHLAMIDAVGGGIAKGGIPVLAFTRDRATSIKLAAYERGADDIVEVPFTLDEIIARPYALLRRAGRPSVPIAPVITLGGELVVDLIGQTVTMNGGKRLDLTPIQQTLLYILAANAGEALTRESLLASIWGSAFQIESNVIDRHVRELRVKLDDDWRTPKYIETVAGTGYRFKQQTAPLPLA
jgi:two-component system response regulator RegX3